MPDHTKQRGTTDLDFGVRVGCVARRGTSILLVRHQKPDRPAYWVLPGGRLEPDEDIPTCARREMLEETNLEAEFVDVLCVSEFFREGRHTVDVTVEVEAPEGREAALGHDPEVPEGEEPTLKELAWVEVSELAGMEVLPAWIKSRLTSTSSGSTYLAND